MAEARRKFDRGFREGAVRIVRETGKPIAQVARELSVNAGTLANGGPGHCRALGVSQAWFYKWRLAAARAQQPRRRARSGVARRPRRSPG
jgi:transposase-like protein